MDERRQQDIEMGEDELTKEEVDAGWHLCPDFDYMLVGPGSHEFEICYCDYEIDGE
jgi:hypothetical protein